MPQARWIWDKAGPNGVGASEGGPYTLLDGGVPVALCEEGHAVVTLACLLNGREGNAEAHAHLRAAARELLAALAQRKVRCPEMARLAEALRQGAADAAAA